MENNNESKVIASTSVGDLEEHPINIEEISDDSDSGIEEPTLSKRQLRRAARKAEREVQGDGINKLTKKAFEWEIRKNAGGREMTD